MTHESILRTALDGARYPLSRALDRAVFELAWLTSPRRSRTHHVIVTPPREGNVGDQAMVESFVHQVEGPVVVIDRVPAIHPLPPERVRIVHLSELLYGFGVRHLVEVWTFARLTRSARSVSILGADMMDGRYALRAAIRRAALVEHTARHGVDARILGFSWNGKSEPRARRAVARAAAAGVQLFARDPHSAERLRSDGMVDVVQTADLVFADDTLDDSAADALLSPMRRAPLAVLNASALVGSWFDQVPDYVALTEHLLRRGRNVVFVPSGKRRTFDDSEAARAVVDEIGNATPQTVAVIDELWSPAQVRALIRRSDLLVTGRMHPSIIALSQGVPPIVMSTQGKVSGLLALFSLEQNLVEPRPGMSTQVIERLDAILDDVESAKEAVRRRLPTVTGLSRRNVAGLAAPDRTPAGGEPAHPRPVLVHPVAPSSRAAHASGLDDAPA
ncbi:polysaccharide pyruvyl transferase family protein [Georgenia alba]|uniref:Polysaccharide pyruvyl transferase family protein n=1 Tax=Georgenia alba TaxID=2233858 RepID=A0ABW2Q556_9MICO